MSTKQIEDPNTGELISLLPLTTLPPSSIIDNIIYFNGEPTDPFPYYKRYIKNEINLRWFGAKGDGVTDDSTAFSKAVYFCSNTEYKTLLIPEGYIFNLGNKAIDIFKITLHFTGGVIKNATLRGANPLIKAKPYPIFDETDVSLLFDWKSADGFAYPEWFGTIPYDNTSVDLKDSLEKLKPFWSIKFGVGEYYSKKGEIPVRHFEGVSRNNSTIIIELSEETETTPPNEIIKFGLCLGNYEGLVLDPVTKKDARSYFNILKELKIITTCSSRKTHYSGVVIGNSHSGKIENVLILQNSEEMKLSSDRLEWLLADIENRYKEANIGLEFRGCSELCMINHLETYSDVGIGFNTTMNDNPPSQEQGLDWPSIYNFFSDCGESGLSSVFFGAPNVYSLIMDGIQSWCRGMYGLYSCKNKTPNSFMHCSINNARIEQLTEVFKDSNENVTSTSIYIDEQYNTENFVFNNIRFAGHSNGFYLGGMVRGHIELSNASIGGDNVPIQYFISTSHTITRPEYGDYSSFTLRMRNITAYRDYPMIHNNGIAIENIYYEDSQFAPEKINYRDVTIMRKSTTIVKNEIDGSKRFIQKEISPDDSLWLKLYHSNVHGNTSAGEAPWKSNENYVSYDIDIVSKPSTLASPFVAKVRLVLFRDGSHNAQLNNTSLIHVGDTTNTQNGKINIVYEASTGFWFLLNALGNEVQFDIEGLICQ